MDYYDSSYYFLGDTITNDFFFVDEENERNIARYYICRHNLH